MKIVLADDEPLARRRMAALLQDHADAEIIASLGDPEAVLLACETQRPDLLLLDIRMPGLDGIATARRLRALDTGTQIIFCTAFEEHALDAWDVRATDYLLKPVSPARLARALQRVRERLPETGTGGWLHARRHGEDLRIPLADVLYLSAEDKYVSAHLTDDEVLLEESLKSLLEQWPEQLLRLHRRFVVPRARLLAIEETPDGPRARLAGCDERLEISRRNLPAVRKLLRQRDG